MARDNKREGASKLKSPRSSPAGRVRTLVALGFGYFVDQGEGQAMSVLFPTLQSLWGLNYSQLGVIGTIRNLLQALTAPLWGFAADKFPRKHVIVFGTGLWGIWTFLCGFAGNYQQLLVLRAVSGIGLGCLLPATFSLIADAFPPNRRGRALGILEGLGTFGIVLSVLALGMMANPQLWRWGFFSLGLFSVISGVLVWFLVEEPVRGAAEPALAGKITEEEASQFAVRLVDVPRILAIPTIWVAIAQGLAGMVPWVVMALYFITWMVNERGFDEPAATIAFAVIVVGSAFSSIIGGVLGDWADERYPRFGRPLIGHISVISGIPLTYILFTQSGSWSYVAIVMLSFFTALLIAWSGKGSKEPMMQAATPPELRASAFAFTTFIESGFAAVAAYVTGALADRIGLTQALLWTIPFPWLICAVIYTLFYWAYPRDRERQRDLMAERAAELAGVKLSE